MKDEITAVKEMKTKDLTTGGIILALIFVGYTFFRGAANIFNAILVPLLLSSCMSQQGRKAGVVTLAAFLILCGLLFKRQLVFSFFYILFALLLTALKRKEVRFPLRVGLLSATAFVGLSLGVKLTDFVFLTRMEAIVLNIVNNNYQIYLTLWAVQSLVIGTSLVVSTNIVDKRLREFTNN